MLIERIVSALCQTLHRKQWEVRQTFGDNQEKLRDDGYTSSFGVNGIPIKSGFRMTWGRIHSNPANWKQFRVLFLEGNRLVYAYWTDKDHMGVQAKPLPNYPIHSITELKQIITIIKQGGTPCQRHTATNVSTR